MSRRDHLAIKLTCDQGPDVLVLVLSVLRNIINVKLQLIVGAVIKLGPQVTRQIILNVPSGKCTN